MQAHGIRRAIAIQMRYEPSEPRRVGYGYGCDTVLVEHVGGIQRDLQPVDHLRERKVRAADRNHACAVLAGHNYFLFFFFFSL